MNVILTYKITESESGRSIAAFLLDSGYSSRLVVHLRNTAESFFLNGKTVFSNTVLQPEDCLDVHVTEKKASEQIVPVPTDLSVVFEDEHVLVIDKPAGMPVHPSHWSAMPNTFSRISRRKNFAATMGNGLLP